MTDFTPAVPWAMLAGRHGRPIPMSDAADEIADKVAEIVVRHLGVAEASVVPTASFIDDLGLTHSGPVKVRAFAVEVAAVNAVLA